MRVAAQPGLSVRLWPDPVLDRFGHDPRSRYVERFWLPVLGPSAIWLLRLLASGFDEHPEGYDLDLADTARALGLGARNGANSPFAHTIARLVQFGFAQFVDDATLIVRPRMGALSRRHLQRLPDSLQREHEAWLDAQAQAEHQAASAPGVLLRARARALARSLIELGEDADATERQLHRWKFHPAIAFDAVRWAVAQDGAGGTGERLEVDESGRAPGEGGAGPASVSAAS